MKNLENGGKTVSGGLGIVIDDKEPKQMYPVPTGHMRGGTEAPDSASKVSPPWTQRGGLIFREVSGSQCMILEGKRDN